jgi:hypothetical protein
MGLLSVLFAVDNVYKHVDIQHCRHDVRVWVCGIHIHTHFMPAVL